MDTQQQITKLQKDLDDLKKVYYATHHIDKEVFTNPVYLKIVFLPTVTVTPTNTPAKGFMVYNTTDNKIYIYTGSAFKSIQLI